MGNRYCGLFSGGLSCWDGLILKTDTPCPTNPNPTMTTPVIRHNSSIPSNGSPPGTGLEIITMSTPIAASARDITSSSMALFFHR